MRLTPEYISKLVNFNPNAIKSDWAYDPKGIDMFNLQVKGSARIYNLLEEHKLALLSDEVGMGKTIQALTVCAALWNEKPSARVLILAPRDEIAKNWEKEYQTFIRHHYRHEDNVVKSITAQEPIKKMIYCPNLYSLVHEIQQGWGQLYIGKISSFSSLMSKKDVVEWLESLSIKSLAKVKTLLANRDVELSNEIARLLKNEIINNTNGTTPYFDLLIIDEAHYFRNVDGDSLKVNSARMFFGDPNQGKHLLLAKKVLLMTATPNHSSSKDIENIVSYFTTKFKGVPYKTILDRICVRRLRRLSKNGLNKYNYRWEIPAPSNFKENPLSEMFFGLYQHQLARQANSHKDSKPGMRGISRMMKYLEGVEFIPYEKQNYEESDPEGEKQSHATDYRKGADEEILVGISRRFKNIFNQDPKHPKYDKLVEDLTIKHNGEKAVVFVRRIPSVFEIAKRIQEFYDKRLWDRIMPTGLEKLSFEKLERKSFKRFAIDSASDIIEEEGSEVKDVVDDEIKIPSSKVLNLFKIIKNDPVKTTHASNFRLKFNHSKPSIFSMFFSPGADYFSSAYEGLLSYRFEVGNEELENYYNSALLHRTMQINDQGTSKDIISLLQSKNPIQNSGDLKNMSIPTLFTVFWEEFLSDDSIPQERKATIEKTYSSFSYYEKESFSNFIEKGSLLASEAIVWFYEIFRKMQDGEGDKPNIAYLKFCADVKIGLRSSKLYQQIQDSILHFKSIYTKVFSINGHTKLLEESWDSFNNAQPVYPYNADNSNQKVLRCFNTPFYPDILIATSVLQEGVNLQYFCNTVYHYGMAWTPGDNEQRIGRIDRMFGKIERLLEEDKNSRLHIYYPYLKDTIDEEHLGRFAKRKFKEESLIDKGKAFEETADFALEENDNASWKQFLRTPDENDLSDPFPAEQHHFLGINGPALITPRINFHEFYDSITNALKSIPQYKCEIYTIDQNDSKQLLIDPTLNGERKQPVVVELILDPIGTGFHGKSVYCLRMRTPLAPFIKFKLFRKAFNESKSIQQLYLPGIKLCLDPSQSGGTSWGLYMANELPLFIIDVRENPLSVEEVQNGFLNLIHCADQSEKEIFNRDLKKEELNLPVNRSIQGNNINFRSSRRQSFGTKWKEESDFYILEEAIDLEKYNDIEKQSLVDNHKNLYVKTYCRNGKWLYQVAYLVKDAQQVELLHLEKHLSVFTNGIGW